MNVKINASGYHDKAYVENVLRKGCNLESETLRAEAEIIKMVNDKIS